MFKNSKIIIILLIFILGCNKENNEISIIEEQNIEKQMISAYNEGLKALEEGDSIFAAKKFNEAELLFPQSIWAERSAVMAGYSLYTQDYLGDAIYTLEQFIKTYPNSKNISYAKYLIAICYYEKIVDEHKDLNPLIEAKKRFEIIIKDYPNSDFALDAKFKIDLIRNVLSSKEMYIAKHYIKKEKWIPAINRLKTIVHDYDTTIYAEEALLRLTEIYYTIGLVEESKKYAAILGYNYLSGEWYKQSYKIFNQNYVDPVKMIKKEKKIPIFKKLKNLKFFN
jgi:outer membrane protein assembly factor BamD